MVYYAYRVSPPPSKDVLAKVLFSELAATMTSVVNISEEEMGIWNATLIPPKPAEATDSSAKILVDSEKSQLEPSMNTMKVGSEKSDTVTEPDSAVRITKIEGGNISISDNNATVQNANGNVDPTGPVTNWSALSPEFIPLAVQLRPYWPERTLNGLFRLYFLEEEFVAATQYCPCVFFPEVIVV